MWINPFLNNIEIHIYAKICCVSVKLALKRHRLIHDWFTYLFIWTPITVKRKQHLNVTFYKLSFYQNFLFTRILFCHLLKRITCKKLSINCLFTNTTIFSEFWSNKRIWLWHKNRGHQWHDPLISMTWFIDIINISDMIHWHEWLQWHDPLTSMTSMTWSLTSLTSMTWSIDINGMIHWHHWHVNLI